MVVEAISAEGVETREKEVLMEGEEVSVVLALRKGEREWSDVCNFVMEEYGGEGCMVEDLFEVPC